MERIFPHMIILLVAILAFAQPALATASYSYEIINCYPHDASAFTQGLVFYDGFLYEGTGIYGKSSLRKVRLEDGVVLDSRALDEQFFGEGITILDGRVFQLTWRERQGFVYDLESLAKLTDFALSSEGWGLTTDGQHLIVSDGSHVLTFLEPETFETIRQVPVYHAGRPLSLLNELEYVEGVIWANVWFSQLIYLIDPLSGDILGWIDLCDLYALEKDRNPGLDVLNGIAYDAVGDRLFVTGKLWSNVYEIQIGEGN